jgi:hypothetical protein
MMVAAVFTALCAGVALGFVIHDKFAMAHAHAVDASRATLAPLSPYRIAPTVERIEIECTRRHVDELPRDYNPFAIPRPLTPPPIRPAAKVRE